MSILPEKKLNSILCRFCPYDYQNNGMCPITEMCERWDMYRREISNLCQQAVDKAVEEAADVKKIAEILPSVQEADEDGYSEDLDYYTAQKISAHIKRAFGKE